MMNLTKNFMGALGARSTGKMPPMTISASNAPCLYVFYRLHLLDNEDVVERLSQYATQKPTTRLNFSNVGRVAVSSFEGIVGSFRSIRGTFVVESIMGQARRGELAITATFIITNHRLFISSVQSLIAQGDIEIVMQEL